MFRVKTTSFQALPVLLKSIPDYSALFTSDRDRSKYRDQNFALVLDGNYPTLGRSHEFNVGISYQDNKENLSFYEEGESMIPDLRLFNGNYRQTRYAISSRWIFTHEKPVGLRLDPFQTDQQTRLYRRQPFCGLALPLQHQP